MSPEQARALFLDQLGPNDTLARYGEKAAVAAILAAVQNATPQNVPASGYAMAEDMVDITTPEYGQGYFCTPDAIRFDAATPAATSILEDLRVKAQALSDFIGNQGMRVYASDLVVCDLRAALARAQVQA